MDELKAQAETGQKKIKAPPARREDQNTQLTVYMVPHSHDDMGWDKTVDEYYDGANNKEQPASVRLTLDGVIEELQKDPRRKFT